MASQAKMHVAPPKKDLVYKCQYTVQDKQGNTKICGQKLSYGAFRTHVIAQHLSGDAEQWSAEQYTTRAISSPTTLTPRAIALCAVLSAPTAPEPTQQASEVRPEHVQDVVDRLQRLEERMEVTWQLVRVIAVRVSVESTLSPGTAATSTTAEQSSSANEPTTQQQETPASVEVADTAPSAATATEAASSPVQPPTVQPAKKPAKGNEPATKKR